MARGSVEVIARWILDRTEIGKELDGFRRRFPCELIHLSSTACNRSYVAPEGRIRSVGGSYFRRNRSPCDSSITSPEGTRLALYFISMRLPNTNNCTGIPLIYFIFLFYFFALLFFFKGTRVSIHILDRDRLVSQLSEKNDRFTDLFLLSLSLSLSLFSFILFLFRFGQWGFIFPWSVPFPREVFFPFFCERKKIEWSHDSKKKKTEQKSNENKEKGRGLCIDWKKTRNQLRRDRNKKESKAKERDHKKKVDNGIT